MANTPNYGLYKPNRADSTIEVDVSLANNFTILDTELKNLSARSLLSFDTLVALQTAHPTGLDSPAWVKAENSWYYWETIPDTTAPILTVLPSTGNYTSSQNITLTTDETATIYYTLDGSTPTTASAVYSSPLSISATTTLKAFARDAAGNASAVQTATYTITTPSFLLANQSGTISWSANTGTRGGGVTVLQDTTITGVGVKGGATGTWSLWKLDNTTFNIIAKLAEGTTLNAPDGNGYRNIKGLNIPIVANDNLLLCFQYGTGIDASGTYRFQTGTSGNSNAIFTWNNRIVNGANGTPILNDITGTGFTYDSIIYHT